MKTIFCDICEHKIEYNGAGRRPDDWGRIKVDHRNSRNIGGAAVTLDLCPKCDKIDNVGSRARAIEFVRASLVKSGGS